MSAIVFCVFYLFARSLLFPFVHLDFVPSQVADDGVDFVGVIGPDLDRALALVEQYKTKTFALRDNSTVGTGRVAAAGTGAKNAAGFFCTNIGWC